MSERPFIRHIRDTHTETYKCINNMTPEYLDLVEIKQSNYSFRYENTVKISTVRTVAYGQRSFRFDSARVWNSLPNEFRTKMSFREFKGLIRTWVGPRCNCAMCGCLGQVSKLCCIMLCFTVCFFYALFYVFCLVFCCLSKNLQYAF